MERKGRQKRAEGKDADETERWCGKRCESEGAESGGMHTLAEYRERDKAGKGQDKNDIMLTPCVPAICQSSEPLLRPLMLQASLQPWKGRRPASGRVI